MSRPRAVVTGAGIRVGRAIALELARSGFDVAVHYRSSAQEAEATAAACRAHGVHAFTVQADLAEVSGCEALVAAVRRRWSGLDLLVNNASIFNPCPFEAIDLSEWDRQHAVNLRAPFLLSQGLLPELRDGDGGVVVHMVDIGADRPVTEHAAYSVSKAGLAMLVKAMAVELAPAVRTVGVCPGQVAWPETYDDATRRRLARRIPMQRVGTPEEVARVVRFLATEATYLNGVLIPVDGGLSQRY